MSAPDAGFLPFPAVVDGLPAGQSFVAAVVTEVPDEVAALWFGDACDQVPDRSVWPVPAVGCLPGAHQVVVCRPAWADLVGVVLRLGGLQVRDSLLWLRGDDSQHRVVWLARAPLAGTVTDTLLDHGVGAINVDGCRVRFGTAEGTDVETGDGTTAQGRWPTNLVITHSPGCVGGDGRWSCADGCPAASLDRQSGVRGGGSFPIQSSARHASDFRVVGPTPGGPRRLADSGGASRYFPQWAAGSGQDRDWFTRLVCPAGVVPVDPFDVTGRASLPVDAVGGERR